jgi:hypothetical protein
VGPVPDGAVGTAVGEGLHAQLGVAHLGGRGEDAGHPLVRLERLALGDAELC